MSLPQIVYVAIIAALWLMRAERFTLGWLTFNLLATLLAAGMMDIGVLHRDGATVTMMTIDLITGAGLVSRAGLPRLISLGYAITVPFYSLSLMFGVGENVTFALVVSIAFAQLVVVFCDRIGRGGGYSGNVGGFDSARHSVALPQRHARVLAKDSRAIPTERLSSAE